ncbi:MAG: ABC transporter ATP-binding protein [Acidobacteriia bacterium]|nr:ABC transporter ATP-binding protein [Terriglobia bacterium]
MLEVSNLVKRFNRIPAVDGVSFTIHRGEILGYLGPNGAGKSTTVKMLVGLMEPTEGRILFHGEDVRHNRIEFQRRLGYVPEEPNLYPHLTGREYLQLIGRLRGIARRALEPRIDKMLRLFSLWEDRYSPLASYSKGMRQKILLSAALLHDPDVLILDEPFSGLDVNTALVLRALLRALADEGKMILYSSHMLEVVEKVCSSVVILRDGKVVADGAIQHLRALMQQPSLEGIFTQLTEQEDPGRVVKDILAAMRS